MFKLRITKTDNSDFRHAFRWYDRANDCPISLVGCRLHMEVNRAGSTTPALVLTTENGLLRIDEEKENRFEIVIPRNRLKAGEYDFWLNVIRNDVHTPLAVGVVIVEAT